MDKTEQLKMETAEETLARKLAALRSFLKFCAREGLVRENAARLVATPKLPRRVPSILSAEEMNEFLDGLAKIFFLRIAAALVAEGADVNAGEESVGVDVVGIDFEHSAGLVDGFAQLLGLGPNLGQAFHDDR